MRSCGPHSTRSCSGSRWPPSTATTTPASTRGASAISPPGSRPASDSPTSEVELIRRAAPLHDVGKIGIPDAILLKPGRLTAAEFDRGQDAHPHRSARCSPAAASRCSRRAERIARSHHERWDGTGYPYGLAGPDIPLVGRIVALADVFDALTHDRPYKTAWSIEDALAEINAQRGRQFDPQLVDTFLALFPASRDASAPGRVAA